MFEGWTKNGSLVDAVCGEGLLVPVTINTTFPEAVTPCMAFVALPSAVLVMSLACFCFLQVYGTLATRPRLPVTKLVVIKFVLLSLLAVVDGIRFFFATSMHDRVVDLDRITGVFTTFITSVLFLACYFRCWHINIISSIFLMLTMAGHVLVGIVQIVFLNHRGDAASSFDLVVADVVISCLALISLCFNDSSSSALNNFSSPRPIFPDQYVSPFSKLMYSYLNPMIKQSFASQLTLDDMWALDDRNATDHLLARFRRFTEGRKSLLGIPWLFAATLKMTGAYLAASALLTAGTAFIMVTDPIVLKLVVDTVSFDQPLWLAVLIVAGSGVLTAVRIFMYTRRDMYCFLGYTNVRNVLANAIYAKMLRLSPAARVKYSAGEIVNLIATDVDRIRYFWWSFSDFVYAPTMIILCFIGLFSSIGINTFYGLIIIVLFIPVNSYLAHWYSNVENDQLKHKDDRLKLMTDALSGMKVLKLYAWEESMEAQIDAIRQKEVGKMLEGHYCTASMDGSYVLCPALALSASFFGYIVIQGHELTPQIAFMTLMYFNLVRYAIFAVPTIVRYIVDIRLSVRRVQDFLDQEELHELTNTLTPTDSDVVIELADASFSWSPSPESEPQLANISLKIRQGELVGVLGRVGAGKSSLLAAIAGEMHVAPESKVYVGKQAMVYVPQEAWIQNKTLRDNITFTRVFNEARYRKVIDACALRSDIKALIAGDATEIGEKGINLSGGQKARVALARAVYQDADFYLLDDTLSAVDAHVGRHIFDRVIGHDGLLRGKTRLFALNSISLLPQCDRIIVMKDGKIVDSGTFSALSASKNEVFMQLIKELEVETVDDEDDDAVSEIQDTFDDAPAPIGERYRLTSESYDGMRRRSRNSSSSQAPILYENALTHERIDDGRLIDEEEMETGMASMRHYAVYFRAFGVLRSLAYFVVLFGFKTVIESSSQLWIANWSVGKSPFSTTASLGVFAGLGVAGSVATALSAVLIALGSTHASVVIHTSILKAVLRAPMAFFDRTPAGRILNRFSKDMEKVDSQLPNNFDYTFYIVSMVIYSLASSVIVLPSSGVLVIVLVVAFYFLARYYSNAGVQIRRLNSKTWSQVMSHLQESYGGTAVIRIFGAKEVFQQQMIDVNERSVETDQASSAINSWIELRLDLLTMLVGCMFSCIAIWFGHNRWISHGAMALVVSTGTMMRGLLSVIAQQTKALETNIVSIERIEEYVASEPEAEWISEPPPADTWPSTGSVRFDGVCLAYRKDGPLVLNDLSFSIASGEKIGIVGRTGAGKTSLTMALFRIVEPTSGTIFIDDVDYRTLGLHDLRRSLTIIPQDPVLFCGTLRSNLDPFGAYPDDALWEAIDRAHLRHFVDQFPDGLEHEVAEGGSNLSVGQRQLVCLARAILRRKTKILILDEATASVDVKTDQLIQESIRTQFASCTVLTIAHRLNTILDYTKVLVMDGGRVKEFDTPQALLADRNSQFKAMAEQAGVV